MPRVKVAEFGIIQKQIAGAIVTFYQADDNGENTGTQATLYQAATGTQQLGNPQTLDTDGKLVQDIYVDTAVIATISNITVTAERHIRKIKQNPLEYFLPVTSSNFRSSTIADDVAAVEANAQQTALDVIATAASASAASTSETNAAASASAAATSETNSGVSETNAAASEAAVQGAQDGIESLLSALVSSHIFSTTTTMADPTAGYVRLNNATLSSATAIAFSKDTNEIPARDISDYLVTLGTSSNSNKAVIYIVDQADHTNYARYYVTSSVTDNTSWLQMSISYIDGSGTLSDDADLYIASAAIEGTTPDASSVSVNNSLFTILAQSNAQTLFAEIDGYLNGGIDTAQIANDAVTPAKIDRTVNALGDLAGGTDDIDLSSGRTVTATISTGAQTLTFSNFLSGADAFDLYLTNGGSQTITWPASVDWAGGTAPTLTTSGVDHLVFVTPDGGTTVYGYVAGLDMQ